MLASPQVTPQLKRALAYRMLLSGILPDNAVGVLPAASFDRGREGTPLMMLGLDVLDAGLDDVPPELVLSVAKEFVGSLNDMLTTCRLFAASEPVQPTQKVRA
jgi:hypothetical protein